VKKGDVEKGDVKIGRLKSGRVRIGTRRACLDMHWLDRQTRPRASRPGQVLWLSVIAGMAHSTLESGAATQNSVTLGHQPKIRQPRIHSGYLNEGPPEGRTISPVIVKSGGG
jgi:hypothetical protein